MFEKLQAKGVKEAEANIAGAFHCKTPDCAGWTVMDDNVNVFKCPLCNRTNCITCQVNFYCEATSNVKFRPKRKG